MPQHELLACAQCGCFAFSCFEDFAITAGSLSVWGRWRQGVSRASAWYALGAVSFTVIWLVARSVAPPTGLTRSFYYPDYPRSKTDPIVEERITTVDLAFIDEQSRPTRDYRVRWHGVWFSPRRERVDFHAGADDGVVVRVDGETVLERHPAVGMRTTQRTVQLEAGAHQLEIYHWQRGGGRYLNVQWAQLASGPASSRQRNRNIAAQARLGKRKWHTESGYSKRSKVETTFHRYKAIVGSAMRARGLAAQRVEARIGCKILNTMTALGMPDSEMIG